ncbi:MAG TPA: molybdopterin-dependent oxidoreductase [Spirochaetota bacterium]|nr:molybdopterin-dependent oxidoreductase [Spirochaetota bacterium]HPV39767.1 molybdopterin-dependent oxidoreductase [Spirochaetota bacterium]
MNYKSGICTFCGTGCGHLLDVRGDKVYGVFPMQNHPVSKGRLCVRGWNVHELLNTPEKITTPLIRKDGKLVEASYDEAVSCLVEKLKKVSPDEIGFLASPRSSNEDNFLLMKLARAVFNTNNISLDSDPGHRISLDVTHGGTGMAGMLGSLEEISKADFMLIVGIDITKQNPIIGSEIHFAARKGARVVTIDTRNTQIAKLSNGFLQIQPGAYKIAIAYMAKVLVDENLADVDFIKKYTEGYDSFVKVLSSLKESEVAEKTGVDIEMLKTAARDLALSRSAMVFFSSGISGFDRETVSYIFNLYVMAGKIGKEGCGVNPITGINNLQGSYDMGIAPDLLTGFQSLSDGTVASKFGKEWGVNLNAKAGKAPNELMGKLKALVTVDHDETIIRNVNEVSKMDFVAYIGSYQNNCMNYAHVVLPIATYVETDGTFTNTERRVQLAKKKIEPAKNILAGWQLLSKIAEKAGAKWSYGSAADVMKEIAKLTPSYAEISHDKLAVGGIKTGGVNRFDVEKAGRKIAFAAADANFAVPLASEEYPILLLIGESQHYWHQNNLMKKTHIPLREYNATLLLYPQGYVAISPQKAKELNVRDRFPVKIVSPYGSMETLAQVTDKVKPNTAYVAYFVDEMVTKFFMEHKDVLKRGEDTTIPVRIVKV